MTLDKTNPGGGPGDVKEEYEKSTCSIYGFDKNSKYYTAINSIISEAELVQWGTCTLRLHFENGKLVRFVTETAKNFLLGVCGAFS
jgi:hypothetical protein